MVRRKIASVWQLTHSLCGVDLPSAPHDDERIFLVHWSECHGADDFQSVGILILIIFCFSGRGGGGGGGGGRRGRGGGRRGRGGGERGGGGRSEMAHNDTFHLANV